MQLLIIVPRQPRATGNHITAERFAEKLPAHGWHCSVIETDTDSPAEIRIALKKHRPTAVLLVHAYRTGQPWLLAQAAVELPFAVLMTGTDYNHDMKNPQRAEVIEQIQSRAAAIILQNQLYYQHLCQQPSPLVKKYKLLPPGIRLGSEPSPLRAKLQLEADTPLFLLPAGIRSVKGNLELLLMCDRVVEAQANFTLAFCGPTLDDEYTASFFTALEKRAWAHYLGEVPKPAIADTMRQADVILNNSRSEGVSNALVEAVSLGRPILANDILGNRAVVQHGKNGLLYCGLEQFVKQALQLSRDIKLRSQLCNPNPTDYSPEREASALATILNQLGKIATATQELTSDDM